MSECSRLIYNEAMRFLKSKKDSRFDVVSEMNPSQFIDSTCDNPVYSDVWNQIYSLDQMKPRACFIGTSDLFGRQSYMPTLIHGNGSAHMTQVNYVPIS